ncbi:hypothetical protein [Sphaerisporangium dianthi]|uniref:Uncharacterized protein n=1 Tax=Sphaerisporangium dianthi TaxID=1436120 RepID=A0ABV9CDE0_9ACTN
MFGRGRSKKERAAARFAEESDRAGPSWQDQLDVAREVVASSCPGELELFDWVAAEFRNDPGRVLGGKRLRAPIGAGVDLSLLTPYVLSAVTFLFAAVTARVVDRGADAAIDKIGRAARDKLAILLRRRTDRPGGDDVAVAETNAGAHGDRIASARFTPAEEDELRKALVAHILVSSLTEDETRQLAEVMIDWLRRRGETDPEA